MKNTIKSILLAAVLLPVSYVQAATVILDIVTSYKSVMLHTI